MRVLFGRAQPDQPDLANAEQEEALNCIPQEQGYGPFREPVALTSSLTGRAFGAYSTRDVSAGAVYTFVATSGALWQQNGTGFTDVSRTASYSTASDAAFEFATFGLTCLAVNGTDQMQVFTLGTSTRFLNQSASASAPIAAHIATVRDFVMTGNLIGAKNRAHWSQINNALRYTPSIQRQADFQDFPGENSAIMKITGGDFAAILTQGSIWRGSYVGSPLIFRFDEVVPNVGCIASGSVSRFQNVSYFLSGTGFYGFDGVNANPIGYQQVDETFKDDFNSAFAYRVSSAIDPVNKLYVVSYPSVASSDGAPDRMLIYGWVTGKWAWVDQPVDLLYQGLTSGYTLEGLDAFGTLDALPYSLDSGQWQGGQAALAAIDAEHRIAHFTGSHKAATLVTGEAQLITDARAFIHSIRPLVQSVKTTTIGQGQLPGAALVLAASIGKRDLITEDVVWGTDSVMNALGTCPVRSNGRYQRVKLTTSGDFDRVMGVEIDFRREGVR